MSWSDFIFPWLEWPLKITSTGIVTVALILFWNNVLMLLRGGALKKGKTADGTMAYKPYKDKIASAAAEQFGIKGQFKNLFKWYGWFWQVRRNIPR